MSAQASHASLVTESLGVISHKDGAKNEYIHLPKLFPLHPKLPLHTKHTKLMIESPCRDINSILVAHQAFFRAGYKILNDDISI